MIIPWPYLRAYNASNIDLLALRKIVAVKATKPDRTLIVNYRSSLELDQVITLDKSFITSLRTVVTGFHFFCIARRDAVFLPPLIHIEGGLLTLPRAF